MRYDMDGETGYGDQGVEYRDRRRQAAISGHFAVVDTLLVGDIVPYASEEEPSHVRPAHQVMVDRADLPG